MGLQHFIGNENVRCFEFVTVLEVSGHILPMWLAEHLFCIGKLIYWPCFLFCFSDVKNICFLVNTTKRLWTNVLENLLACLPLQPSQAPTLNIHQKCLCFIYKTVLKCQECNESSGLLLGLIFDLIISIWNWLLMKDLIKGFLVFSYVVLCILVRWVYLVLSWSLYLSVWFCEKKKTTGWVLKGR